MPTKSIKVAITCERCGTVRWLFPSNAKQSNPRFCSRACFYADRRVLKPLLDHPTDPDALLVPLTKDMFAIVDRSDRELVETRNWWAQKSSKWYARSENKETGGKDYLHCLLMNAPDDVDHRDGDGLNCRRSNMRPATRSQNLCNKSARSSSGFKGVIWDKTRGKWRAEIQVEGKHIYLGRFETAEEAALAYDNKAKELHKEFAHLNFPSEHG